MWKVLNISIILFVDNIILKCFKLFSDDSLVYYRIKLHIIFTREDENKSVCCLRSYFYNLKTSGILNCDVFLIKLSLVYKIRCFNTQNSNFRKYLLILSRVYFPSFLFCFFFPIKFWTQPNHFVQNYINFFYWQITMSKYLYNDNDAEI